MSGKRLFHRVRDQARIGSGLGARVAFLWLGVCVGMVALLFAICLEAAVQRAATTFISFQGVNNGQVLQPNLHGKGAIQRRELVALRRALSNIAITGAQIGRRDVSNRGRMVSATVIAEDLCDDPASRDEHLRLVYGSWLDKADERRAATVCLLSEPLAGKLFPQGDAVGRTVRIGHVPFRVKGVITNRHEVNLRKRFRRAQGRLPGPSVPCY